MTRFTLNKAILLTVLAALLPVAVFGIVQSLSGREYVRQLIGERLVTSALATMSVQREPIDSAMRILASLSHDPDVVAATGRCDAILASELASQQSIVNFGRVDARGFVQCSALPFVKPLNNDRPSWWYKAIRDRRFTLSPPLMGKITKRRVIAAVLPLFDEKGAFQGALTASIDASWIENALEQRKLSPQAIIVITDETGKVLIGGKELIDSSVDLRASFGAIAMLEARDGSKWMYSSAPLARGQLYVAYAEPARMLLATSRDQLRVNVFLPVLTLVLTWLAIWWAMNHYVIRWLRSLSRMANQIARGHYDANAGQLELAPAELASLGADLQDMAKAIAGRDAELRSAAEATKAMAREVNHRVKNNLQMVMSLLGLHTARLTDPEARNALEQTRLRMAAVSLIHRLLYEFGERSEHGEVDMDRLLHELCGQLRTSCAKDAIMLECHASVGVISVDQAIPLTLLIVEAVTNAYRHAYPVEHAGRIVIDLTDRNGERILSIVDDGAGFDQPTTSDAMGRELMTAFASQLGGTLETIAEIGRGVAIILRYPLDQRAT